MCESAKSINSRFESSIRNQIADGPVDGFGALSSLIDVYGVDARRQAECDYLKPVSLFR